MIKRQERTDSIHSNGPSRIIRPSRNIIIHPIPSPGGFTVYYTTVTISNLTFSQTVAPQPPSSNYLPVQYQYGPWTNFFEGKMLGINAKVYSITANLINVVSTASVSDVKTGTTGVRLAEVSLELEVRDQTGAYMFVLFNPLYVGGSSNNTSNFAGNSHSTIYGAQSTPPATPSYPTQYRWACAMRASASITISSGILLLQASVP